MFSTCAVALLSLLLLAPRTALGQMPANCSEADADAGTHYCQDCRTGVICVTADEPPEQYISCTKSGEACALVADTSTCVPLSQSPCSCDKLQQCDAYDSSSMLVCLDGDDSTVIISPCPETAPTCVADVCTNTTSPGSPCSGKDDGFVPVTPDCTSAVFCLAGSSEGTVDCGNGQFFDPDPEISNCATLPPPNCDNNCMGSCPNKMDCSKYYVCDSSGLGIEQDCPTKQYFDPRSKRCQGNETLCLTHDCVFDVTPSESTTATTTTPAGGGTGLTTTAAKTTTDGGGTTMPPVCDETNVYNRYPYEGNCKMYWLCALLAPGVYGYVAKTCQLDYVFNPVTTYCDYPWNVPDCVVPTTSAP